MQSELFDFEEKRLRRIINNQSAKRILIQLPEGLKSEGFRLASFIEETGVTSIISADPCYGACDLPLYEAESLGVDLIIHYGHTKIIKDTNLQIPIVYLEARTNIEVKPVTEKAIDLLKPWKKVGLTTSIQHIDSLNKVKKILQDSKKTVYIGDACNFQYPGQILGCDYSNAKSIRDKVGAFLFIGGGRFHALGLSLTTMKPTIVADPFQNKAYSVTDEAQRIIRKRWAEISKAKELRNFAVIIGLKKGQKKINIALEIKKSLSKHGKKTVILALHEINPGTLLQFPNIEAYVNTACPRVAFDESLLTTKPVLSYKEAQVMMGEVIWEDLLKDGII